MSKDLALNLFLTRQTMVTCEDLLIDCSWQSELVPCAELFVLVPTDDGLCCGFNNLDREWRPDHQKTDK